jgi:hypothetical protein
MTRSNIQDEIKSAIFFVNETFTVGQTFTYEVTIFDISGNSLKETHDLFINDRSGPRILVEDISKFTAGDFGGFNLQVALVDNGSEIESAILEYNINGDSKYLTLSEFSEPGGAGSQSLSYKYKKVFKLDFSIPQDFQESINIRFTLHVLDTEGNEREYSHSDLIDLIGEGFNVGDSYKLQALANEVISRFEFQLFVLLLIISIAFIAVRRFRTISGFDKSKILEEMVRIPDNEVWEENDKISIGVYANFFDQVKGPVPIIWHPEKAGSSERIRFAVADRSFSTLGFVSKPEEIKDATFRFTFAGEKCSVFGYAFAIERAAARGGQENMSICFMIRPPYGTLENLNKFRVDLLDHLKNVSNLIKSDADIKIIQREMQVTREFLTRAMLTFRRKYRREFIE